MSGLFPPVHCLLAHLHETRLRFAVGESADGSYRLVGILLGQGTGLSHAVALIDKLASLEDEFDLISLAQLQMLTPRSHCLGKTYPLHVALSSELAANHRSQLGVLFPGKQKWCSCKTQL